MPRPPGSHTMLAYSPHFLLFVPRLLLLLLLAIPAPSAAVPDGPIIDTSPDTGNLTVFDPTSLHPIPQFPATDGGSGKLATVLWVIFGFFVGLPTGVCGLRGGRLTTGAGCGLVAVVTMWAAFINSLSMPLADSPATADLVLTLILFASFAFFTFLGAFLRGMHPLGLGLIGAAGGTSLFIRVAIFKRNLLISIYPLNLALLAAGAIMGVMFIIWKRRLGILIGTSLLSTFLVGLSIDLVLNMNAPPEQGMSRGLRLLMDRNAAHLADIVGTHYVPSLQTQILLGVSLGLVPVFAYTQHRLFAGPFTYHLRRTRDDRWSSAFEEVPEFGTEKLNMAQERPAEMISGAISAPVGHMHGSRFST